MELRKSVKHKISEHKNVSEDTQKEIPFMKRHLERTRFDSAILGTGCLAAKEHPS